MCVTVAKPKLVPSLGEAMVLFWRGPGEYHTSGFCNITVNSGLRIVPVSGEAILNIEKERISFGGQGSASDPAR